MRLPIRAKLILFIGLPTLLIALGVLFWTLQYVQNQTRQLREAEMVDLVENAAARFDDYISKAARVAETTARGRCRGSTYVIRVAKENKGHLSVV